MDPPHASSDCPLPMRHRSSDCCCLCATPRPSPPCLRGTLLTRHPCPIAVPYAAPLSNCLLRCATPRSDCCCLCATPRPNSRCLRGTLHPIAVAHAAPFIRLPFLTRPPCPIACCDA